MKDKSRYSAASKARWSAISPGDRSRAMSALASKRWAKATKEDKILHMQKMLSARIKSNGKVESTEEQAKE